MDIDTLRELITLSERKNYLKAAEQLYISQSALSRHISALEKDLDVRLFERNNRQVRLTEYGETLIPFAEQIIRLEDECVDALEEVRRKDNNSLVIGAIHGLAGYGIMDRIAGFVAQNRDMNVSLIHRDGATLKEMLDKGEVDVIIIFEEPRKEENRSRTLTLDEDRIAAILPEGHALADRERIGLDELKGDDWIMQEDNRFLADVIREMAREEKVNFSEADIHSRGVSVFELVRHGLGIAFGLLKTTRQHSEEGLVYIPLIPRRAIRINMVWSRHLSPAGSAFADHMKKNRR